MSLIDDTVRVGAPTGGGARPVAHKYPVTGTPISNIQLDDVLAVIADPPDDRAQTMAFCNVHSVMSARSQPSLAAALAGTDVAAPDGMPVVWWLRQVHGLPQHRVDGPSMMDAVLRAGVAQGWRHFLYGSTPETLDLLTDRLASTHPGAEIVGAFAPPFRPLTPAEEDDVVDRIRAAAPTVVWVGLGMPKQELWMHEMRARLPGTTLMGVGAAFDMLAGRVQRAPAWMRDAGLEWLYRLVAEPRRLWRRYILNNPAYLVLLSLAMAGGRLSPRGH